MEKAAGEGAPARAIERRQPEREEHGEGYERKKRGRLPPGALREPQRQMPQAPNRPGGKTGREKGNSSLKLRLQDRSPTQFLVTGSTHLLQRTSWSNAQTQRLAKSYPRGKKSQRPCPPAPRAGSPSSRSRTGTGGRPDSGSARQPPGQPQRHRRKRGSRLFRAALHVPLPQPVRAGSRGGVLRRPCRGRPHFCHFEPGRLFASYRGARRHGVHGNLHRRHEHSAHR